MKINKPIFIVGLGRSGSSIFYEMLSYHPDLAWLSATCDKYPSYHWLNNIILASQKFPLIGNLLRKKYGPEECYSFWELSCKGFRTPYRNLVASDVTVRSKRLITESLGKIVTPSKQRLLLKITGWPRIQYLHEIFNDALFIHIKRDPHAVANSFLNVPWWWGWRGPSNWRWGPLSEKYSELWNKHDQSYVALAGIACKIFQDEMNKSINYLDKDNFLEINYEDFCEKPIEVFQNTIRFCDLKWSESFEKQIKKVKLTNSNYKWRQDLTETQQKILESTLNE